MKAPPSVTWETLDWAALDRLRAHFLSAQPSTGSYWQAASDLASYDFTYAQRIGWKWDAVIAELELRGWRPPAGTLLDWGCGSGIAARCVLDGFGAKGFESLELFDRSPVAVDFAMARARQRFASLPVRALAAADEAAQGSPKPRTLLISHVLNELDEAGGHALRAALDQAAAVIWVEPGTFADSRSLIAMREALQDQFRVVAPCTHQSKCGLLHPANERHWCHHFAPPPPNIMADSAWVQFAHRAGLDLRSNPYSFLVLERPGRPDQGIATAPDLAGCSRVIGQARIYKGFAKIQSCQADGVRDLELQKRDCPEVFKAFAHGTASPVYRWTMDGRWIRQAENVLSQ
jgi:hypothetical protein